MMASGFFNISNKKLAFLAFFLLVIITFLTAFYGAGDIGDYSDTSKFFAGKYSADIRSSHSYFLGFLHSPFVKLTNSFIFFKITSLIFLALIIYSLYRISNRDKKTFWLSLLCPVVWYMAPFINPIQLASLFFLWAYYFIKKYDENNNLRFLLFSGLLIGLGWVVWDTILYFGFILGLIFLFNKRFSHAVYFAVFILIGLLPRLILDQFLFNFAFFTTIKTFMSGIANLTGGIYDRASGHTPKTFASLFSIFLAIPLYFWRLYKPGFFKENNKTMIFLTLSILLILLNPQIRYTLVLVPIILLLLGKNLDDKQFKRQIIAFIIIILFFIFPYIVQINYSIDNQIYGVDSTYLLENSLGFSTSKIFPKDLINQDLENIAKEYPNEVFLVGNQPDDYQILADIYWQDNVKEFVSIQDYELYVKNETILYEKIFMPVPNIPERRQFWIAGGLRKTQNDKTDFKSIEYGIGLNEPLDAENFVLVKKYNSLYLSKKA